jgi:enterochelin esterase-like enzyme
MIEILGRRVAFTAPVGATHVIGDFTDDKDRPIPLETGQTITFEFPLAAFVEYCFLDAHGNRLADPSNPENAQNPWWREYRAVQLEGYKPHPLLEALPEAHQGTSESLTWDSLILRGKRRAYLHLPPNFDPSLEYPVFIVQDGVAFRRTGKLGVVHDNLLHLNKIRPCIFCFLEPQDRTEEYYFNPKYLDFLIQDVCPRLESRFKITQFGLWGASLGGLASLYVAMQAPTTFPMVVTQSGVFQGKPNTTYARGGEDWLTAQFEQSATLPLRISADCGTLEWLIGTNRHFAAMLHNKNYTHQYLERPSGHNWVTWRNGIAAHLEWHLGLKGKGRK